MSFFEVIYGRHFGGHFRLLPCALVSCWRQDQKLKKYIEQKDKNSQQIHSPGRRALDNDNDNNNNNDDNNNDNNNSNNNNDKNNNNNNNKITKKDNNGEYKTLRWRVYLHIA